jgi:hypothetical protein
MIFDLLIMMSSDEGIVIRASCDKHLFHHLNEVRIDLYLLSLLLLKRVLLIKRLRLKSLNSDIIKAKVYS